MRSFWASNRLQISLMLIGGCVTALGAWSMEYYRSIEPHGLNGDEWREWFWYFDLADTVGGLGALFTLGCFLWITIRYLRRVDYSRVKPKFGAKAARRELLELAQLREKEAISQEEYDAKAGPLRNKILR